jgi:predicted transcriptional regulator
MQITYNEIAELIGRTEANIKYMKKNNPNQLEILKLGALCKKFNICTDDLKSLNEMKEKLKEGIK